MTQGDETITSSGLRAHKYSRYVRTTGYILIDRAEEKEATISANDGMRLK